MHSRRHPRVDIAVSEISTLAANSLALQISNWLNAYVGEKINLSDEKERLLQSKSTFLSWLQSTNTTPLENDEAFHFAAILEKRRQKEQNRPKFSLAPSENNAEKERIKKLPFRISVSVFISFLLLFSGFGHSIGWLQIFGGCLLLSIITYGALFFFLHANFLRRALITVSTGTAFVLVNSSINYTFHIGELLVELGVATKSPNIIISNGSISWPPLIGLLAIILTLYFSARAERREANKKILASLKEEAHKEHLLSEKEPIPDFIRRQLNQRTD